MGGEGSTGGDGGACGDASDTATRGREGEGACAVLSACWAAFSFSVDLLGCVAFRKPLSALQSRAASPLMPPKAQAV